MRNLMGKKKWGIGNLLTLGHNAKPQTPGGQISNPNEQSPKRMSGEWTGKSQSRIGDETGRNVDESFEGASRRSGGFGGYTRGMGEEFEQKFLKEDLTAEEGSVDMEETLKKKIMAPAAWKMISNLEIKKRRQEKKA